jgi:MFS family permease
MAVILAAGVVSAFQIGKLPASIPVLRADLNLGLVAAGWVVSTISLVGVAAGMATGWIGDRIGHRRSMLLGMGIMALGTFAGAAAWDAASIIASRFVEGIGYIAVITAAPSLLATLAAPKDRSLAMGVWSFYLGFGLSGMVVISPPVLDLVSWRGLWLLNGVILLLALAAFVAAVPAAPQRRSGSPVSAWPAIRSTLSRPGPYALAICFGTYSLIHLGVVAFLPTFLIENRGVNPSDAALMTALAMFMNAPGCLLGGWLLRLGGRPWWVAAAGHLGMFVCALGIYPEYLSGDVRYALAVALPFFGGFIPPALLDHAPAHATSPAMVATTIGLIMQFISLGQLLGPPLVAMVVASAGSWSAASDLTAASAVVGLAAAGVLWRLDLRTR